MWQRPALTRLVLKSYAAWKSRFEGVAECELMCVGSEGSRSRELAERAGWSYLYNDKTKAIQLKRCRPIILDNSS